MLDGATPSPDAALRPIPARRYGAVIADPPWRFAARSAKGEGRSPQRHYRCMDGDAILGFADAVGLDRVCAADCGLLLWATFPLLPLALAVLGAWGFRHATGGAWGKEGGFGTGYWYRNGAELWLLGLRGQPPIRSRRESNFIHRPRGAHSRKPDDLHGQAQRQFAGPYLELFARRRMPGWDAYGDALGGFVGAEEP